MSGIRRRNDSRSSFRSRVSYRSVVSDDGDGDVTAIERGHWNSKADYLFTCIGYAVGLGNICRFPYLTYENGGGVFFIPYFLMLFICGIPLFMAELALGQYSNSGAITVWNCLPAFKVLKLNIQRHIISIDFGHGRYCSLNSVYKYFISWLIKGGFKTELILNVLI